MPEPPPDGSADALRVLFFGTYDVRTHPRVLVLQEGLRSHTHTIEEINVPLGLDTSWRVRLLRHPWLAPVFLLRIGSAWVRLALQARRAAGDFDAVVVGYLGHFDVHLAHLLFPRSKVVLDYLVSARATAQDRKVEGGLRGRLLDFVDRRALSAADIVLVDTAEHARTLPTAATAKAVAVRVGAPTEWFREQVPAGQDELSVVFFGLYTPLQGAPVIGEAIARLGDAPVRFTMIGHGQDLAETRTRAAGNDRVAWIRWVPPERLPAVVARHDVCLGIFGTSPKAKLVVPNKVFQGAAAGCAVVTSDTAPQRAALDDAAIFVPPGDAEALADVLRRMARDRSRVEQARVGAIRKARTAFAPEQVVRPLIDRLTRAGPHGGITGSGRRQHVVHAPLTPRAWLRYDLIRRAIADAPDAARVLEVGAGQGAMATRLAMRFDYTAVERDDESASVTRARLEQLGTMSVFRDIADVANADFDVVCAFEVLEHVEDDFEALASWAKRLRPGGRLVLSVPAYQSLFGPSDVYVGHFRRYDPAELEALLLRAGFVDVQLRMYGFPLGYVLEAARNAIIHRRAPAPSMAERTGESGRLLQPPGWLSRLTALATVPFRLIQRPFERTAVGTGIVAWARWE